MQRRCTNELCGCLQFDHEALAQLPVGERTTLPISPEMASGGDLFIGRSLQADIDLAMIKGLGAKTIADMNNIRARERYDLGLLQYLEQGDVWWLSVVATCSDEPWSKLSEPERTALANRRAIY